MGHERNRSGWPSPWQKNPKRLLFPSADGFWFYFLLLLRGRKTDTRHSPSCLCTQYTCALTTQHKFWWFTHWNFGQEFSKLNKTSTLPRFVADLKCEKTTADVLAGSLSYAEGTPPPTNDALLRRSYLEIKFCLTTTAVQHSQDIGLQTDDVSVLRTPHHHSRKTTDSGLETSQRRV